jgi:LysM repeat protein
MVATSDEPLIGSTPPDSGGGNGRPPSQAPSPTPNVYLYRGALLALVVGSLVAVYLVLRPPETESVQPVVRDVATSTPVAAETATATPEGQQATATATALPATPTPEGPTATPTPEPGTPIEYEVQSGDFISTIAEDFGTTVDAILELNPGLDPDLISVGQVILIPSQ